MKKSMVLGYFVSLLLVSCSLFLITSCGSSGTATTTTTCASTTSTTTTNTSTTTTSTTSTTSTTIAPGSVVSINGSLNAGTMSISSVLTSGIKTLAIAYSAIPNYAVAAVSKNTGMTYFASAETDSLGNFSIPNLPAGEKFYLEILNADNKLVAPVAFGTIGGDIIPAVAPGNADLNLGQIVYESAKNTAAPSIEPTSKLDPNSSVEAKGGETLVPKGAGNFGKGTEPEIGAGTYNSADIDGDKDGLPNMFDADNDGDLRVDEFDGLSTMEMTASASTKIEYSFIFTNLHVQFMDTLNWTNRCSVDTTFWLTIGIQPKAGNTISSAYIKSAPSWVQNARVGMARTQFDDPTDYNSYVDQLWSTTSPHAYKLWKVASENIYATFMYNVIPSVEVKAGDTIVFTVNFNDGTSEEVTKMVNYTFSDIPKLKQYKFGSAAWSADIPDSYYSDYHSTNIDNATTTEVALRWYVPKDESGNMISGESFYWEIFCDQGAMSPRMYSTSLDLTSVTISDEVAEASVDLTNYITTESFGKLSILIGIKNRTGDNASQTASFTRTW